MTAVLPFDLERGWREASPVRRALVWTFPPLLVFWALLAQSAGDTGALNDWTAVLGGFVFYAVARTLRPHEGVDVERILRHGLASTAMSCATNFFVVAFAEDGSGGHMTGWSLGLATLGLVTTLPWGFVSLLVRASQPAPRPLEAAQPRV